MPSQGFHSSFAFRVCSFAPQGRGWTPLTPELAS